MRERSEPGLSSHLVDSLHRVALFDDAGRATIDRAMRLAAWSTGAPIAVVRIGSKELHVLRTYVTPGAANADALVIACTSALDVLRPEAPLSVCDLAQSAASTGLRGRFAAVPLALENGDQLGTLAVLDLRAGSVPLELAPLRLVATDIMAGLQLLLENSERRQRESHLSSQKRVLRLIAAGAPLSRVMPSLATHIEEQSAGALCSITVRTTSGRVQRSISPAMPEAFLELLDTDAARNRPGRRVLPTRGREHLTMLDLRDRSAVSAAVYSAAVEHGFRSCWSAPITLSGEVLGWIDLFRVTDDAPGTSSLQLLAVSTAMARIAVERRRADANLRRSEIYFRSLTENSTDMKFVLNPDGSAKYLSPSALRLLDVATVQGFSIYDHVPEAEHAALAAVLDAIRASQVANFQFRVKSQGGQIRYLLATGANLLDNAAVCGLVLNARDVTEHNESERALRASEERYRLVSRATNDVIWDWDLASDQTHWSGAVESVFGVAPDSESEPRNWWSSRVHPEDLQSVAQRVRDVLASTSEDAWSAEYRLRRADGNYAVVLDRGFVVRDGRGRPARMIGSMLDLTVHRDLEEQFRHAQRMEAVGQLAGGVAHDFNNMLTVISGFSTVLRDPTESAAEQADALDQIEQAAIRAAGLTRQLLAFSRKQLLQPKVIDLNQIVRGVSTMLRRLIGENIQVELDLDAEIPPVFMDPGQLEQVIMNLVVNARDAMPSGGLLRIRTAALGAEGHRSCRLTIEDSGCGMSPETLSRVLEPFFTTKEVGVGTGLGLSTVYGIVEQSGGRLDIESAPGAGTRVHVHLAAATEVVATTNSTDSNSRPGRGSEAILVVEDDAAIRALAPKLLTRYGYSVRVAEDGPTACAMIQDGYVPDILLSDVVLPGMNGRMVAEHVRRLVPGIAVVFMSGYTDNELGQQGVLDAGTAFVQKPFTVESLLTVLRSQLDEQKVKFGLAEVAA